jgi:hypothetical protein
LYQTKVIDANPLAKAESSARQFFAQVIVALHNEI